MFDPDALLPDARLQGCAAATPQTHPTRPLPDPQTGELKIDPDILLKAKRFNLAISFFYSSASNLDMEYGRSRAASVRGFVASNTSDSNVVVVRGDFTQNAFTRMGSSGGITTYTAQANTGAVTTLSFDGTAFTEYFPMACRCCTRRKRAAFPLRARPSSTN